MFKKLNFLIIFATISALQNIDFLNHYETLEMSDIHDISPPKPTRGKRSHRSFHNNYAREMTKKLAFTIFKRKFVLNMILDTDTLRKDAVFIESRKNFSYQKFLLQDTLWLYNAYVKNEPRDLISQVTLSEQDISATIITRNETYFIDSLNTINESLPLDKLFTYRLSDFKDQQNLSNMWCGMRSVSKNSSDEEARNSSTRIKKKRSKEWPSTKKVCTLALTADINFFRAMGRSNLKYTFKLLINLITKVNAIFSNTLLNNKKGYHLEIQQLKILTDAETPEEYNLLDKKHTKKIYNLVMQNNLFGLDNDGLFTMEHLLILYSMDDWNDFCLSHLFTHADYGSTVGLAFSGKAPNHGGICDKCTYKNSCTRPTCLNAGVTNTYSSDRVNTLKKYQITAHGHNFGAFHDPAECIFSKEKGGYFLMNTYANTGRERNNDKFSECSRKSIEYLFDDGKDYCFKDRTPHFCGNGVVEEGEECDEGNAQDDSQKIEESCCTKTCRFKKGAECSPYNSECCDVTCRARTQEYLCRVAKNHSCINDVFCDGVSFDCPNATWKANHVACFNQGLCMSGRCMSRCTTRKQQECQCTKTSEMCLLCCKDTHTEKCEPYLKSDYEIFPEEPATNITIDNSTRYIYLEDKYPCVHGYCFERKCLVSKKLQMFSARTWNVIPKIASSYTLELIRNNIVFIVFFFVLFFYVIICFFICLKDYIDKLHSMKIRAWYSLNNDQLFAEGSTVKIINLEAFQRKYPKE